MRTDKTMISTDTVIDFYVVTLGVTLLSHLCQTSIRRIRSNVCQTSKIWRLTDVQDLESGRRLNALQTSESRIQNSYSIDPLRDL